MPKPKVRSTEHLFQRVQLGLRMNKRVVKVLKATAEYMDMPLSALIESMAVTALEGGCIFGPDVMKRIEQFKEIYGLNEMLEALPDGAYDDGAYEDEDDDEPEEEAPKPKGKK